MKTDIQLIATTYPLLQTVAQACWVCTHTDPIYPIDMELCDMTSLINRVLDKGHLSVLRHVSFTFLISKTHRNMTHQLVRSQAGWDFSQQSQRYVPLDKQADAYYILAPDVDKFPGVHTYLEAGRNLYNEMTASGIKMEDARDILAGGSTTNIVATANGEAIHNFTRSRCCYKAQTPIRNIANEMLALVREVASPLFHNAGRQCATCPDPCEHYNGA